MDPISCDFGDVAIQSDRSKYNRSSNGGAGA
jgi:hypothetical protein